jgi:uncharacterized protein
LAVLRRAVSKHPLTWFVVTAYALSWWSIPFANGAILPYGPFVAAVLVLSITKGRSGLVELLRRMTSWRGGWLWLLIAPGLVILYLALAFAINLLLGGTISQTSHLSSFGQSLLGLLLLGGMWEEPGWSGFALPLLQDRNGSRPYGLLKASLIMGFIRAGWHLPLVVSGSIPWFDAVFLSMAFQFLISWLHNRTGGSVLTPMLFHLTSNVVGGGIMISLFSGSDRDRYYVLFVAIAWMLALAVSLPRQWSMGRLDSRTS